jgi:hypothetical protein
VVRDRNTNERLILSNNHVLANSNDASPGDAILQPGPADGGSTNLDQIATLERFIKIDFGTSPGDCSLANSYVSLGNAISRLLGSSHRLDTYRSNPQATNLVDAALARPLNDADVLDEILEIGTISGTTEAFLGMPVRKSGRTTGFTTGQIAVLNSTVSVSHGVGKTATFQNLLVAGPMSQGGFRFLVVAGDSYGSGLLLPVRARVDFQPDPGSPGFVTGGDMSGEKASDLQAATQKAMAVKQAYEQELLSKPNVVGVGVGFRQTGGQATDRVVVVMVKQNTRSATFSSRADSAQIEDVPADVQRLVK